MIKRELYLNRIRDLIDKDMIKVLTGVRRCGKTTMLNLIIDELKMRGVDDENIIYISFEEAKYRNISNENELTEIVMDWVDDNHQKKYLFFDEIQIVNNWQRSVNSFRVDFDCDIYITGSNSTLLSGELATLLTGRFIEIRIYPFSFNEFLEYKKQNNEKINEVELFNEYMIFGGFPEVFDLNNENKTTFLKGIYNSILYRDITLRHDIQNPDMFERLVLFLIDNIGNTFSSNSLSKYVKSEYGKLSVDTISRYLSYLTYAFLFIKVKREDLIAKELLKIREKYYLIDTGFYNAFINKKNTHRGFLLENMVFNELIRRGYEVNIGKINGFEIDFVAKKTDKRIYIQVSETILDENTRNREFYPLTKVKDFYPKYVLTLDNWDYSQNGIIHMNIIDFLKEVSI